MDIEELLEITVACNASDLHLSTGSAPIIRIDGQLQPLDKPVLTQKKLNNLIKQTMSDEQYFIYSNEHELDYAFCLSETARFRVNAFQQSRGPSAAFRSIPFKIPTLDELNLSPNFSQLCEYQNGIVLVTGAAGSGKSTTLAAMLDYINTHHKKHILTIEDPIEFIHSCKKSLVNQRELNRDTMSFAGALRSALRVDPDIIMVGEMRDLDTIRLALSAAETGHLVFATLHTSSAAKTINRIIDVFPGNEQNMIRSMLSESLRGIIAQTLIPRMDGGRLAAAEVLISTPAIRHLIRENKVAQIYSAMQTGKDLGMRTFEQHVVELAQQGLVHHDSVPKKSRSAGLYE